MKRIKKSMLCMLMTGIFLLMGQMSYAQNTIENNVRMRSGSADLTMTLYHEVPFGESAFGYTDYIYLENGWAEVLPGLYYMPGDAWMVALYGGIETDGAKFRPGAFFMWNLSENVTFSAFGEYGQGDDNYWYDTSINWNFLTNDKVSLYVQPRARRFHGIGLPVGITKHNLFGDGVDGFVSLAPFVDYELDQDQFNFTIFFGIKY